MAKKRKGSMKSIKNPKQYRKLKSLGFTKSESAAISNASYKKGKRKKRKKK